MEQYLTRYLAVMRAEKGYSENTLAAYQNDLAQFTEFLRTGRDVPVIDPQAVTGEIVAAYVKHLRETRYATATVARKVSAVRSFFQFLIRAGVIALDPAASLNPPKVKKSPPKTLLREDVERLIAAPGNDGSAKTLRDRALLELLYATGMRVSEVVTLNLADIDLDRGEARMPGRGRRDRALPLGPGAQQALADYLNRGRPQLIKNPDETAFFVNHRGRRLTRQGLWLIIKEQAKAVGIADVTPHTLRHSFARHLLNDGTNLKDLQARLGHANLSTTQVYALAGERPAQEAVP